MTQATGKRRGHGEDSIYWAESKSRFVGAVSLGFSASGTRVRKKVTGRTKAEVRDKLRELHKQVETGLRPQRRYTVGDTLEDWLAHGVDGLSARTATLYRGTIVKAVNEERPADGGGAGTALGSRGGLGRRAVAAGGRGRVRSRAAGGARLARRPGRRGYEDTEIPADAGAAAQVC
jgi:hypothetical protein